MIPARRVVCAVVFVVASLALHLEAQQPSAPPAMKDGYVEVGAVQLYYEEAGEGLPIVLLHGGLLDRRMWDPQMEALSSRHRVIRYDARNHGRTKGVAGSFTHYDDLRALLDHFGIEKATLTGLSLGGRTVLDFAIAYPERVSTIVLVSPGASGYEFGGPVLKANAEQMSQAFRDGDLPRAIEFFQRSWTDGPSRSPSDVAPDVRNKVRDMALATIESWNPDSVVKELDPPAFGRLGEIQARTLVVVGALDMPGILEIAAAVEKEVEGAEVVTVDGAAHMVNMEKPQEFNRIVLDFLARAAPRPASSTTE
jgi:pimeloyl-ACP methyl ester carboxylesterase